MDDLKASLFIAGSGMYAQGTRLRTIAENIANVDSTAQMPGGDPYQRKLVKFKNIMDRDLNANLVRVENIAPDQRSSFKMKFDPSHPAADGDGYVKYPNVSTLVELMDMREANRTYDSNLKVIEAARSMYNQTLSILR
ncbi:MAG: flagellar basal body rod protein FlgC [Alphaproteobacteria bacterium]